MSLFSRFNQKTVSLFYGNTQAAACSNRTASTLYHSGSLGINTKLYSKPGILSKAKGGYYRSGTTVYFANTNGVITSSSSCPVTTTTTTPRPTTTTPRPTTTTTPRPTTTTTTLPPANIISLYFGSTQQNACNSTTPVTLYYRGDLVQKTKLYTNATLTVLATDGHYRNQNATITYSVIRGEIKNILGACPTTTTTPAPTTTTPRPTTTTTSTTTPGPVALTINGNRYENNIPNKSDRHWYYFTPTTSRRYEMRTWGLHDGGTRPHLRMDLWDESRTSMLLSDYSSSGGKNQPLIKYIFEANVTYYLRVFLNPISSQRDLTRYEIAIYDIPKVDWIYTSSSIPINVSYDNNAFVFSEHGGNNPTLNLFEYANYDFIVDTSVPFAIRKSPTNTVGDWYMQLYNNSTAFGIMNGTIMWTPKFKSSYGSTFCYVNINNPAISGRINII